MFEVVDRIRKQNLFPIIEVGFLECNEPSIPDAIEACILQGAEAVIAVPYFLHTGNHVADDIPTLLLEARERHTNVTFRLGSYLGNSPLLTEILVDRIQTMIL